MVSIDRVLVWDSDIDRGLWPAKNDVVVPLDSVFASHFRAALRVGLGRLSTKYPNVRYLSTPYHNYDP